MAHKNKLTLLFTASILMLSSCGETNSSSSDANESSKAPDSSSQVKSETPSSSETKEESSSKETPVSSSSQASSSNSKEEISSSEESSSEPISSSEEVPSSSEEEPSSSEEIPSSSEEEIPSSSEETPSSSEEIPSSSEEQPSSSEETPSSEEQPSSSEDSSSDSPSSSEEKATYTVTFDSMGGSEVPTEVVEEGNKVTKPADPTKENYVFDGWYLTDSYKKAFDFDTEIYTDYVLYAKWKSDDVTPDPEPEPEPSVTYVDYWIAGTFCSWSKDGAIQMEANPNGTDLAMKLGVEIAAGECFKITNFSDWIGYRSELSEVATSGENENIVLKETGTYNIYLNSYYQVWVEKVSSTEEGESTSEGSSSSESTGGETSSESEGGETSSESSSEPTPEESSSESTGEDSTEQISIHAPANSSLVEWYLVGEGSLWEDNGWTTTGGIQLFSNPEGEDLACILNLDIAVGDTFKIFDGGVKWIGYSEIDDWDDPSNLGKNNFEDSNTNFKCKVAGTYNIYLNEKDGNKNVWIAASTITEEE